MTTLLDQNNSRAFDATTTEISGDEDAHPFSFNRNNYYPVFDFGREAGRNPVGFEFLGGLMRRRGVEEVGFFRKGRSGGAVRSSAYSSFPVGILIFRPLVINNVFRR